nr:DUF1254 domain-containing protein [Chloroflexia bacterium]
SENRLRHSRSLTGPEARSIPTPNVDTLYSKAQLELSDGPVVLTVPPVEGRRYYSFQFLDPYTNVVGYVGTRSTGNGAGHHAVVPPGWDRALPAGVEQIDAPYEQLWAIGRTAIGEDDSPEAANGVQDGYRLTGLSEFVESGPAGPAQSDARTPQEHPIPAGLDFFDALGTALAAAPPPAADAPLLDQLRTVGIGPGERPSANASLNSATTAGLNAAVGWTRPWGGRPEVRNGWEFAPVHVGDYGTDYCLRAAVARGGLGANTREESLYVHTNRDHLGAALHGRRDYAIHLKSPPPADAFWSLTAYGPDALLVCNPLRRYALGSQSGLRYADDGSTDLYLSHGENVPHRSNWLPTPAGEFGLVLRLYLPQQTPLDGTWAPPPVAPL